MSSAFDVVLPGWCRLLVALSFLALSTVAKADWSIAGAEYACLPDRATFTLNRRDETSSDPPEGAPITPGFTVLGGGESHLHCTLGKRTLNATVDVSPPRPWGHLGAGMVRIESLTVDGVNIVAERTEFGPTDYATPGMTWISVRGQGRLIELQTCDNFATPATLPESSEASPCRRTTVDIDGMIAKRKAEEAAHAAIVHHLDPSDVQAARALTTIAPTSDLAVVYADQADESEIPICAHWGWDSSTADDFVDTQPPPRQVRVRGTEGDRALLRRAHPLLCRSNQQTGCSPESYVLAGDLLTVDFVCGAWTHAAFEKTAGWIETARLYDVDTAPNALKLREWPNNRLPAPQTDLAHAVKAGDVPEVSRLLNGDRRVDDLDRSGVPLMLAVRLGNEELVRLLLNHGGSPRTYAVDEAGQPAANDACAIAWYALAASEPIYRALLASGLALDCVDRRGSSILSRIALANRLVTWATQRLRPDETYADHPVKLTARAIEAGADPNLVLGSNTALLSTVRFNNTDVAHYLLEHGADPNLGIATGSPARDETPLGEAISQYRLHFDPTIIELLIGHGANVNFRARPWSFHDEISPGRTALIDAARTGDPWLVEFLLNHGADPLLRERPYRADGSKDELDDEGRPGRTPEQVAIDAKHPKVAAIIRRHAVPEESSAGSDK